MGALDEKTEVNFLWKSTFNLLRTKGQIPMVNLILKDQVLDPHTSFNPTRSKDRILQILLAIN